MHTWKPGAEPITRNLQYNDGIYFNGGIYFLRFGSSSSRFTLDDNLSKIPALPRLRKSGRRQKKCTMVSNGVLHLFSKQEGNLLRVYETKEIENEWTKKYKVDFNPIFGKFDNFCVLRVLGMIGGEKVEDSLLLFTAYGKLMIYMFCDSVFEVLLDYRNNGCSVGSEEAHHFIQTLAPV